MMSCFKAVLIYTVPCIFPSGLLGYSDDLRLRDEILDKIPWALPVDQV